MGLNVIGSLGDPQKVADALKPLVDGAEDKALAEIHAVAILAVTTLQQEISTTRDAVMAELQEWRKMVAPLIETGQVTISGAQPLMLQVGDVISRLTGVKS